MKRRSILALASSLALVLVVAVSAFAYWTAHGSGTASAGVGTLQTVTLQPIGTATAASTLIPGGSAELVFQVNNPNSYDVNLISVTSKSGGSITASNGCSPTGVTLATPTNLPVLLVPGVQVVHLTNGVSMSTASTSACQGATFNLDITITVQK